MKASVCCYPAAPVRHYTTVQEIICDFDSRLNAEKICNPCQQSNEFQIDCCPILKSLGDKHKQVFTNKYGKLKRFLMLIRYFESEKIAAGSRAGWAGPTSLGRSMALSRL